MIHIYLQSDIVFRENYCCC